MESFKRSEFATMNYRKVCTDSTAFISMQVIDDGIMVDSDLGITGEVTVLTFANLAGRQPCLQPRYQAGGYGSVFLLHCCNQQVFHLDRNGVGLTGIGHGSWFLTVAKKKAS